MNKWTNWKLRFYTVVLKKYYECWKLDTKYPKRVARLKGEWSSFENYCLNVQDNTKNINKHLGFQFLNVSEKFPQLEVS